MSNTTPQIDLRTQKELAEQIRMSLVQYCPDIWSEINQIASDQWSDISVQIYARLMEVIIKHINRVPDKNFLAFLDTLGVGPLPPKPAKTALSFALAKGAPSYVKVPAGTQIAAEESADGKPIIFETTKDLDVIQAKPIRVVSVIPSEDKWRNHSSVLLDEGQDGIELLLSSTELIKHRIYFSHSEQFAFEENKHVTLKTVIDISSTVEDVVIGESISTLSTTFPPKKGNVRWYTYSQESEEPVELTVAPNTNPLVADLLQSGDIYFENVPPILEKDITGYLEQRGEELSRTGRWIFAELTVPVNEVTVSNLQSVNCLVIDIEADKKYYPELAFSNKTSLDVTKDFYPFGERPKYNDTFYLASQQVFAKHGAEITIEITFTSVGVPSDLNTINLTWEYWDGTVWQVIPDLTDNSVHFTVGTTREVTFTCPQIKSMEINGENNVWIRVRLTGGDYGKDVQYAAKEIPFSQNGDDILLTVWSLESDETFAPPLLQKITFAYSPDDQGKKIEDILTYNNFFYQDHSKNTDDLIPFQSGQDGDVSSVYFGFDKNVSNLPINLFFPLITEVYAAPGSDKVIEPPRLKWEYWDGTNWSPLGVEDETKELTRRGIVSMLLPESSSQCACFDEMFYWVRAGLEYGEYVEEPRLKGIYANVVWAQNKVTVNEELLGSGNGTPGQQLKFSNFPILPGQQLYVRESEITAEEKQKIESEEGSDAFLAASKDSNISETWVRWHEVNHFWFSGPHSRHYLLDRKTGTIIFGDGEKGMIPQAGRNNIKALPYMYGGGSRGNVKKNLLTKMRKAVPYVDSVINPVDAEGGSDVENLDQIRIRGPRSLRHRNKAVTLTDYEWLIQEASTKIARVKGLSVTNPQKQFKPGWVTMMVVPYSSDVKPLPSAELISEVSAYLSQKAPSCLTDQVPLQQINLIPPNYLRVDVVAKVAVKSISDAKEVENLGFKKLMQFFHPLEGGADGKGWEFGRDVYKSEIYETLEEIEKVDYIHEITLTTAQQIYEIEVSEALQASVPFPDHSKVLFDGDGISMALAEEFVEDTEKSRIRVLGFMEGDRIELKYEVKDNSGEVISSDTVRLYVLDCIDKITEKNSHCFITCSPVEAEVDFPAGETTVETYLKPDNMKIRSYLKERITKGETITGIKIAVPAIGDRMVVVHRDWQSNTLSETVNGINNAIETIYLEKDYLVYSGNHYVIANLQENLENADPVEEELLPDEEADDMEETEYLYLVNTRSGEVHDLSNIKEGCSLQFMKYKHMKYVVSIEEIQGQLDDGSYDYCAWCFGKDMSEK